jgi:hypothetical protein
VALVVVGAGVGFALVGGLVAGLAAAGAAVLARAGPSRLRRWLPVVPGALMALVAAYVVAKTVRYPIPADLDWPGAFSAVDPLAWAAVAVTVTLVLVTPTKRRRSAAACRASTDCRGEAE